MKTDKLQDAIGGVRDQYILDAHEKTASRKRGIVWKKVVATAACICICVCAAVPALAAADNEFAYDVLYSISPSIAQKLKPIRKSCEDNGIKMEVLSADIRGDSAEILVSMQDQTDSRLDETTDLFDSYSINTPFNSTGTCNMVFYDAETKTATFLVSITQWDNTPIPGDKITFSVNQILSQKQHTACELTQIDLSNVPEEPDLLEKADIRGYGGVGAESPDTDDAKLLAPQGERSFSPTSGVTVMGYGIVDNKLHIQAYYENILKTDNHGDIYLKGQDGHTVSCTNNIAFWDDSQNSSYEEYIFDVPLETLNQYQVCGEFWTCKGPIEGNWQITFPLTSE